MNKEQFIDEVSKLGIILSEKNLKDLETYYNLLIDYNNKVNLTAITKKEDVYLKHFYDSLTLVKVIELNKDISICDIGTGAGFPGLVLKIIFPNLNITLVDALDKRIKFLDEVIKKLNLTKIKTIHSRIEDLKMKEEFDIVVSRAVAKTNILLELGCQLPKINGLFILMKGEVKEELNFSNKAMKELNYQIVDVLSFTLPYENSQRNIVKLKKISQTASTYPRIFSQIKKNSL